MSYWKWRRRRSAKYKKNFCRVSGSADIGRSKGCQKCSSRFLSRLDEDEKKEVEPKRYDE